jgi:hypothetical protein
MKTEINNFDACANWEGKTNLSCVIARVCGVKFSLRIILGVLWLFMDGGG